MSPAFAYPWDDPTRLEEVRSAVHRSATYLAGMGDTIASATSVAFDAWSGAAAQAAAAALGARTDAVRADAERLGSTATALDTYRSVVVDARAEIDELRARQAVLGAARADSEAAARAFVGAPSPAGAAELLRCLARGTALRLELGDPTAAYHEVVRRVSEAGAACAATLWRCGAGLAAWADDLSERAPGTRDPDDSPETNGDAYPGGLGPMVPGTSVPTPDAPPWPEPDAGAGEHDSEWALPDDYLTHRLAWLASVALDRTWPHAADNLRHFLGNSGDAREQDVDQMLADLPGLSDKVQVTRSELGEDAIAQAQAAGVNAPVTFPVSTGWQGYYAMPSESEDWYYASGGFSYSLQGEVTVYPPSTPGGEWTYEMTTAVSTYDRYNWDGSKSTEILGQEITDEQLGELHRAGIAQEYDLYGTSSTTSSTGSG